MYYLDYNDHIITQVLCLVARLFNTFPLSYLANSKRHSAIPMRLQICVWFAGLRGAIAFGMNHVTNHYTPYLTHVLHLSSVGISCQETKICTSKKIHRYLLLFSLTNEFAWGFFCLHSHTALSLKVPTANSAVIVTSTIVTVVFTTFIFGGMTEPFLRFMQVKGEPKPVSHELKERVVVCCHGMPQVSG